MRFAIETLGCKVNQYDSAIIEDRLRRAGLEPAESGQIADVYVVNTCTVTDRADVESLRIARRVRRKNPNARVIMTGCLAQASPGRLAESREVDAVIGLGRLDELISIASGAEFHDRVLVSNLRKQKAEIVLDAVAPAGQTRAFLKLQEGCDQFCSFCIVPVSRGTSRSASPRQILETIDEMHSRGFEEVILSGVHLGGYGKDLDPPVSLMDLLEMIAERSPIDRIRLSSIDPEELSPELIDLVASSGKFCPHFHLPLQSGDDQMLAAMRRRYDSNFFSDLVGRILQRMPDAAIGTDLIVGFPGETIAHFERYFNFVDRLPLAYFHVFPYSVRTGTTAAKMSGKVAAAEITTRARRMRELGERKHEEFLTRFIGRKLQVLFEDRENDNGELKGYSRNYIRLTASGEARLRNREVEVLARFVSGTGMVGEVTEAAREAAQSAPAYQATR